jgi:hypothetical protein
MNDRFFRAFASVVLGSPVATGTSLGIVPAPGSAAERKPLKGVRSFSDDWSVP